MSDTKPDAPPLVKILKQLALHRTALYESGYDSTTFLARHAELHRQFCDALKSDDQETAAQLLDSLLEEAGIPCSEQARKEMHNRLALVMDTRNFTLAYGAPEFDAGYADFGPEAAAMCDTWGSKADRDAYWHHPLLWLCRQLEESLGIDRDDLKTAAYRLDSTHGLREMEPFPNPDGSEGDPALPDCLGMFPKFKELDRDGTTTRLWQELVNDHPDVLIDAKLLDAPPKSANGKPKKQKGQRKVSDRLEVRIKEAIRALPPESTQKRVAEEADVSERTVRESKAWENRRDIWGTAKIQSGVTEVDQDSLLDIEEFVNAKLDVTHHMTKAKVKRLLAKSDTQDQLFAHLLEVDKALGVEGKTLHELPDDQAKEAIRMAAEKVTETARPRRKPDKCPV